jgi:Uma2 family endonuclease
MSLDTGVGPIMPLVLHLHGTPALAQLSRSEFFDFCHRNGEVRIERTTDGDLSIMPFTGGETGRQSGNLFMQLANWSQRDGTGLAFDSSTGFWLPNGAMRSPDTSWVLRPRWEALTQRERQEFPPLAPDFVLELRSPSDRLAHLQAKLYEYVDNGVRLGWLIDPSTRRVEVYRPGESPQVLDNPATLSAEPELPGFELHLGSVW